MLVSGQRVHSQWCKTTQVTVVLMEKNKNGVVSVVSPTHWAMTVYSTFTGCDFSSHGFASVFGLCANVCVILLVCVFCLRECLAFFAPSFFCSCQERGWKGESSRTFCCYVLSIYIYIFLNTKVCSCNNIFLYKTFKRFCIIYILIIFESGTRNALFDLSCHGKGCQLSLAYGPFICYKFWL